MCSCEGSSDYWKLAIIGIVGFSGNHEGLPNKWKSDELLDVLVIVKGYWIIGNHMDWQNYG
jgi:hypothetical protein